MLSDGQSTMPCHFLEFFPLCQFKILKMLSDSASDNSEAFYRFSL